MDSSPSNRRKLELDGTILDMGAPFALDLFADSSSWQGGPRYGGSGSAPGIVKTKDKAEDRLIRLLRLSAGNPPNGSGRLWVLPYRPANTRFQAAVGGILDADLKTGCTEEDTAICHLNMGE